MKRASVYKVTAIDPLKYLDWPLHEGQRKAWDCEADVILLLCGTGGGKTTFTPAWLFREIQRRGQGDYLACSSTFPVFNHSFLPSMLDYFCRRLKWGVYKAQSQTIQGNDGSRILCRSGTNPNALESGQFKAAALDEWGQGCIPIESWEAVNRRLARYNGRALIPTTPYNLGWLKSSVWDRANAGDPRYAVINFKSIDNPAYHVEAYERARRELPDWKFQMFYNGIFTRPAGLIYDGYSDSYAEFDEHGKWIDGGNLVKAFSIPQTWLRDVGVDFGASHHCARLWVAEDPVTHYGYIYREQCGAMTNGQVGDLRNGPEYAQECRDYREPVRVARGGARSESEHRSEWAKAGFAVSKPLIYDVEAGIDHQNGLFKSHRWFVFDVCAGYRAELGTYSRELDAAGEPTLKIAEKATFHRLDAGRYIASGWPLADQPFTPYKQPYDPTSRTIESMAEHARMFGFDKPQDVEFL